MLFLDISLIMISTMLTLGLAFLLSGSFYRRFIPRISEVYGFFVPVILVLQLGIFMFGAYRLYRYVSETTMQYLLVAVILLICLEIFILSVTTAIKMFNFIRNEEWRTRNEAVNISVLIVVIVLLLTIPSLLFGMYYNFTAILLDRTEPLSLNDYYYFSLTCIYDSLPSYELIDSFRDTIGSDPMLRYIAVLQVIIGHIVDLIFISFVVATLTREIDSRRRTLQP